MPDGPRHLFSHEPAGYECPFCRLASSPSPVDDDRIVHRYDEVLVTVNLRWWPRNPGGLLVIPNDHHENVYELPATLGTPIQQATRDAAFALKDHFRCDGVSTRQHNEPAGHQDVWHYHVHVFARWHGDELYRSLGAPAPHDDVVAVAGALRAIWRAGR